MNKQQPILSSERWSQNIREKLANIENQIHEKIKHIINKKYNTINAKIKRMKKQEQ